MELIEEDQAEEKQNQINLELLENIQYEEEVDSKPEENNSYNTEIIDKDIYGSYKKEYKVAEELPLPNINNLRKWIKNEKKAS